MPIDPDEFEDFRAHRARIWATDVGGGLRGLARVLLRCGDRVVIHRGIGLARAAAAPRLRGSEAVDRRQWLKRFPELAHIDFKWQPDPVEVQRGGRLR